MPEPRLSEPAIISLVGLHNSGKTTVGEAMVRHWSEAGITVAVLKHHGGHGTDAGPSSDDWEKEGSDTRRYAGAGAVCTVLAGAGQTLWRVTRDPDEPHPSLLLERMRRFLAESSLCPDVLLVEGYKHSDLRKVIVATSQADVEQLISMSLRHVIGVVCPVEARLLVDPAWRVYHDTDVPRLCFDIIHP